MNTQKYMVLVTLIAIAFSACKEKQMYLHLPDGTVKTIKASECETYIKNAAAMGVTAICKDQPF